MNIKSSLVALLLCAWSSLSLSYAACLNNTQLETLKQNEQTFLLGRVPPAFAHALEDKRIELEVNAGEGCTAMVQIQLPATDLEEANRLLDADPAKKIMLGAQGYTLPETTTLSASWTVDPANLDVPKAETLQIAPLGKLRASVEMMYALLTQARAHVPENSKNEQPWNAQFKQAQQTYCMKRWVTSVPAELSTACECRANQLASQVSERQMAYIEYVNNNPYAMATGNSKRYAALEQQVIQACQLRTP